MKKQTQIFNSAVNGRPKPKSTMAAAVRLDDGCRPTRQAIVNAIFSSDGRPDPTTIAAVRLDEEYRLTRAALLDAGVNMTDSIDALYRDWRRWRNGPKSRAGTNRVAVADADQWWARHLAQFRTLIDPLHVAARAERARKDRNEVCEKPRPAVDSMVEPLN